MRIPIQSLQQAFVALQAVPSQNPCVNSRKCAYYCFFITIREWSDQYCSVCVYTDIVFRICRESTFKRLRFVLFGNFYCLPFADLTTVLHLVKQFPKKNIAVMGIASENNAIACKELKLGYLSSKSGYSQLTLTSLYNPNANQSLTIEQFPSITVCPCRSISFRGVAGSKSVV